MQLYNTLTKRVEKFSQDPGNEVKMYCCGPTVYDFAHIGNLRTFIFYDVLRRVLTYNDFKVKQVINITDVDDKTIRNAKSTGMGLKEYTEKYTKYFFEDIDRLNIQRAELYPRATENINDMKMMVLKLIEAGYGYTSDDGIYYSVSKFKDYGKLSGIKPSGEGFRIKNDEYDKDSASDFALWKNWSEDDGKVFWESELPKGRPGWHIECSTMAIKYLGETVDIHSGGVDLIFPHHENEIAQSEGVTGKQFVRYWAHGGHLLVDGKKMSKSLHNFYTLRDLEKLGFDPISFRLLILDAHYRSSLDFGIESLKKYERTLDDIDIAVGSFKRFKPSPDGTSDDTPKTLLQGFDSAINDDFDTHHALEKFFKLVDFINKAIKERKIGESTYKSAAEALDKMNSVLGIIKEYPVSDTVLKLAKEREELRSKNEWGPADAKRNLIKESGFKIIDMDNLDFVVIKDRKYGR